MNFKKINYMKILVKKINQNNIIFKRVKIRKVIIKATLYNYKTRQNTNFLI